MTPTHPRAKYIRGLDLVEKEDFRGAIKAYKTAIDNYPATDHFHLNEVWINLGTVYYALGEFLETKVARERAIKYLPEDPVAKDNLNEFIYENPAIPEELKRPRSRQ